MAGPRSSKVLPKAELHQKSVMVTARGLAHLIHYSFLNPTETMTAEKYAEQMAEMHQKLWCLQPAWINRKGLILLHDNARLQSHNQCFKS